MRSILCIGLAACAASGDRAAPPSTHEPSSGAAARAIVEADLIQIDDGTLYAMSKSGSVSIVDISHPDALALLGQTQIEGEPFEMYRRGDVLIAMTNDSASS